MDILKLLLGNSGGMIDAMSQKSGLGTNDVEAVISKIAPIFMQRANENFKSDADSSNFLEMIRHSNLDEMTGAPQNISVAEGNELLGVLTGSKENSRALASDIGSQLGISADSIKTLLPMIAPMIAGMLNNQLKASNLQDSADSGSMMSICLRSFWIRTKTAQSWMISLGSRATFSVKNRRISPILAILALSHSSKFELYPYYAFCAAMRIFLSLTIFNLRQETALMLL